MKLGKKRPLQKRSKVIVDSIVESTTRILESIQYDQISTNKIAKKAGVSIGSLYQYFKNRESVYDLVFDEMIEKNIAYYSQIFEENKNLSLEKFIEILVSLSFDYFLNQKGYLTAIHSMQVLLGKSDSIIKFRMRLAELTADKFVILYPELGTSKEAIKKKAFLSLCLNFGIIHSYIHAKDFPYTKEELRIEMIASTLATLKR